MSEVRSEIRIPEQMNRAIEVLLEGVQYSEQTNSSIWDFAIEMDRLQSLGLYPNDLRWLIKCGIIEQQREVTHDTDDGRAFRQAGNLTFTDRSCFVLTNYGTLLVRKNQDLCLDMAGAKTRQLCRNDANIPEAEVKPIWDGERRILFFDGKLVKQFRWAAENQEAILFAFEEDEWPKRIDDPLRPFDGQDTKRRLSDTIKCLNRKQSNALLHFRGDGTGEGVVWETRTGTQI